MKVLFLDIDGVLNSTRSCIAHFGYPHGFTDAQLAMFDLVAVGLIQRLCQVNGISVVVSSSWRINHTWQEIGRALGLPTIDSTPRLVGSRGKEIAAWLEQHPEVQRYAIVDDDSDMLPEQTPFFVKTNGEEGLTMGDFRKLCEIFGVNAYERGPLPRPVNGQALDWSEA